MSIWGHTKDGVAVPIYTLKSAQIEVRVTAYGAHLVSIRTPDRTGKMADIVLGFDTVQNYQNAKGYSGRGGWPLRQSHCLGQVFDRRKELPDSSQ